MTGSEVNGSLQRQIRDCGRKGAQWIGRFGNAHQFSEAPLSAGLDEGLCVQSESPGHRHPHLVGPEHVDLGQAEQEEGHLWIAQRSLNQRGLDIWREGVVGVQYSIWPVDGCAVL